MTLDRGSDSPIPRHRTLHEGVPTAKDTLGPESERWSVGSTLTYQGVLYSVDSPQGTRTTQVPKPESSADRSQIKHGSRIKCVHRLWSVETLSFTRSPNDERRGAKGKDLIIVGRERLRID